MLNLLTQNTFQKKWLYEYRIPFMNSTAKILVPNKEWLIKKNNLKIGTVAKSKKGYVFLRNGQSIGFKDLAEVNSQFGVALFEESIKKHKSEQPKNFSVYDFPCGGRPYDPVYNIKQKLPLYSKSTKSKSLFCAGYYIIQFNKGWRKAFCPKLITLERYPYQGPFKSEDEMKFALSQANKTK